MHFLSLGRRCCPARTDRPDRLIGNERIAHRGNTSTLQNRQQLPGHHFTRQPRLTLRQGFANTKHRHQASTPCRFEFGSHKNIRFGKQATTLGMPHQHMTTTELCQHVGRNFTGKSPDRMLAKILSTKTNPGPGKQKLRLSQIRKRRTNKHLTGHFTRMCRKLTQQLPVSGQAAVHLPVSGD